MRTTTLLLSFIILCCGQNSLAQATEASEFTLIIKDHKFLPAGFILPANKKIKLIVDNQDESAEEFESYSLNREKVIPGKTQSKIFIGPLKPGNYDFFGDFHPNTAKGQITVQ